MEKIVYTNREIIITGFVILACLALSSFFPAIGTYQNMLALIAFLIAIPFLYIKLILKRSFSDFGLQIGDWKKGVIWAGISLIMSLLLAYVLINYSDFLKTQIFIRAFKKDFSGFLSYEIFFMGTLVVAFEFFFRGFVMESFLKKFRHWAMAIQFGIFLVFLLLTKTFDLGLAYFAITALFSGWIVFQSRSILYSIGFSWLFILIADAFVVRLIK
jgi:membrane protease YdiL (CAAX protease family)